MKDKSNFENIDLLISQRVASLEPITLDQMSAIKLMNRTDTKFVTNKQTLARLLEMTQGKYYAQFNNGSFVATYMTTYWDTDDHVYYMEHHNGRANRRKVRVRTYMDSDTTFLEVKRKNNHGRTNKKRIEVPSQKDLRDSDDFLMQYAGRTLDTIRPTVRNRFHRITLVNKGKTERLTIDFDISFHNFETNRDRGTGNLVIIELKRDGNVFSPVLDLLRQLRVKPSGFSKYCIGSVMTNPSLKTNLFRPKLIRVRRLVGDDAVTLA
ncbi:MAG: polyphosphate polymerase domain-containing protein [Bacteroidaceae bacterium]|nr:polyphosphate polymerase domain-containing protein [Bacteroidaceae bacterium]MDE6159638.1 polyphosphate polymerase domain-containing protein [Bacteroidaceae bacterium]